MLVAALAITMSLLKVDGQETLRVEGLKSNLPVRVCDSVRPCLEGMADSSGVAVIQAAPAALEGKHTMRVEQQTLLLKRWKHVASIEIVNVAGP